MVSFLAAIGVFVTVGAFLFGVPPIQRAVYYRLNALNPNAIPDVQSLIQLYWRGIITEEELKDLIKKYGYDEKWANGLIELGRQYLTVSEMMELYRRGEVDKKEFVEYLFKNGVKQQDALKLIKLAERLLGAGDLVELLYRKR